MIGDNLASGLKSLVERICDREDAKRDVAEDIKELYAECRANGYNVKALRKLVALRRQTDKQRQEREAVEEDLTLYMQRLGMLS